MTEEQIKHMAERFLCWKLPENFNPDNGISYAGPIGNNGVPGMEYKREPSGTNLFGYTEAKAMVEFKLQGLPDPL